VTTGQVEVTVEKSATAEVERVMRKSVGDFMVTVPDKRTAALPFEDVVLWSVGTNESNDIRDAAPQGGGKWIRMSDNGARCTMGYVVQNASSAKRGLSAGHCAGVGDTDDDVTDLNLDGGTNGQIYGNVLVNSYANNQPDAMSWPIASWDGNARVYMSDSGWKTVVGYLYEANQSGVQVCGTGWGIKANENTDQKCNPVIPVDYSFTEGGVTTPDTNCFERRTYGGDSGGPVYGLNASSQALAAGITKGSRHTYIGPFHSYYWCFVTIDDALSGVGGLSLVIGK
jgi:hypothetical protein